MLQQFASRIAVASPEVPRIRMFEKEKLIPLVALLVFVVAVVGILYGSQWDWVNSLRGTPALLLGIAVLVVIGVFGARSFRVPWGPRGRGGLGQWLLWIVLGIAVLGLLAQLLGVGR